MASTFCEIGSQLNGSLRLGGALPTTHNCGNSAVLVSLRGYTRELLVRFIEFQRGVWERQQLGDDTGRKRDCEPQGLAQVYLLADHHEQDSCSHHGGS